jgi:hypothetical protein
MRYETVFLFDVDNTLLDNDRVQADLDAHIHLEYGTTARDRCWDIFDKEEELADVERLYPANRYVMIDDKLRILDSMKKVWGDRLTSIFPHHGHYATDPEILARYPHGDLQLDNIGDLIRYELTDLVRQ